MHFPETERGGQGLVGQGGEGPPRLSAKTRCATCRAAHRPYLAAERRVLLRPRVLQGVTTGAWSSRDTGKPLASNAAAVA